MPRDVSVTRDHPSVCVVEGARWGLAVVVGCSHPGIEKTLDAAAQIDKQLYTSIGGFHLVQTPRRRSSASQACCTTRSSCSASRLAIAPASLASRRSCASLAIDSIRLVAVATIAARISRAQGAAAAGERLDDEAVPQMSHLRKFVQTGEPPN